jgi:DMSO/TMAO reductase YedYZ molybdopterin-dependent catalytic subunit
MSPVSDHRADRPAPSVNRPAGGVSQSPLEEHRALIHRIERRGFLRGTLSLGALTVLTGCDVSNDRAVQATLRAMSGWNDRVQAFLFNPRRLAPTYSEAQVLKPPRFNAFYSIDDVKPVDGRTWRLELAGLIADKRPWTIDQFATLPQVSQITRHVCVEGWDYIGKWSGVALSTFLQRVGADTGAKFVGFKCFDGYSSSIDMPTALHPQTQLTTRYADAVLPNAYGFPLRLRVATKLGFKTPKWITAIEVTNRNPGGYWEDRGYNWFSGI